MNKDFTFEADEDFAAAAMPVSSQSPWEFSAYSHTVAEEHFQRRTTSIDDKILRAKARKQQYKLPRNAPPKTKDHADTENGVDDNSHEEGHAYIYKKEGSIVEDEQLRQNDKDNAAQISQKYDDDFESGDEQKDDSDEEEASKKAKKSKKSSPKGPTNTQKKVKRRLENGTKQGVPPSKFFSSDEGASFSAKTFLELNLSRPLLRACDALGYKQPTPIQAACIPLALTGRDICGSAVTGSGKTAAFSLPLLERLLFRPRRIPATRVLILTPTRELAVQIHSMIEKLSQYTDIRCCLVVGGLSSKVQEVGLQSYPEIVVATPGRMIDHLHNTHSVGLEDLAILILDEADRLLELGFSNEVQELVRLCPRKRQTMLFSATMTEEVNELVKLSLANPVRLSADPSTQRPATLLEEVVRIRPQHEGDKEAVLLALCSRSFKSKVIIFSGTKMEAHRLKILFGLSGLKAAELHGNLTQAQRLDALELFKEREVDFLIATDVAARGLDIVGVETVVNFECPRDITMYVHRVGRTARAGQQGCAVTFVSDKDHSLLKLVAKRAGSKLSSRIVPVSAILKWHDKIVDMESSVRAVISEEREERILRKAEMEANKAQNLMDYESEIFSRPQKVWFQTSRERRQCAMAAKAAKIAVGNGQKTSRSGVFKDSSSDKSSRKRSLEREKNMTRKKRRRLEAAHEAAEGISDGECSRSKAQNDRGKMASKLRSTTVAEFAYSRAKAVKALDKARESGKLRKTQTIVNKDRSKPRREKQRRAHMKDLFQGDMNKPKEKVHKAVKAGRRPGISKRSFKSKARYKRR